VTSLALSHDHTYVASGHSSGHIRVFDLNNPGTPARVVAPTNIAAVKEGRREGHFAGSPVTSIGFIAGRHTAIVTADDTGLAFYHSLGKVLFVDATDVIRILGKYPEDLPQGVVSASSHRSPGGQNGLLSSGAFMPFRRRRERKANTILSMAPLPLGTCPHKTDAYNIIAMLTPTKLVIVGLKPTPTTWYRRSRGQVDGGYKHRWKGSMAWFPSVDSAETSETSAAHKEPTTGKLDVLPTTPMLVYTWGNVLHLIRVSERKIMHPVTNRRTGKVSQVEVGTIVIEEFSKWTIDEAILAVQWLNLNVGSFFHFCFYPETPL
jgi:vacuolar protein sorting-associated protein 8